MDLGLTLVKHFNIKRHFNINHTVQMHHVYTYREIACFNSSGVLAYTEYLLYRSI